MPWGHLLRLVWGVSYSLFFTIFFFLLAFRVLQLAQDMSSWFLISVSVIGYVCFVQLPATCIFGRIFLDNVSELVGDD